MAIDKRIERFHVVLIKPSKYDDDGYVIRFWKGVLPSNTLNVLHGLTDDIKQRRFFGDLPIEVTVFDETAEKIPMRQIIRWGQEAGPSSWFVSLGCKPTSFRAPSTWREFSARKTFR
jgi:hypothetical protein